MTTRALTDDDKRALGSLCTRDESGKHFTQVHSDEWLQDMEEAGYIRIHRPAHSATGIPYDNMQWSVEVAEEVADWFDAHGNLYTD